MDTGLLVAMGGGRHRAASWGGRWLWWVRVLGGAGAVAVVLALVYRRLFRDRFNVTTRTRPTAPALPPATRRPAATTTAAAKAEAKGAATEDRGGALPLSAVRGRRLTCSTRGVVLELDRVTRQPRLIESAVPVLLQLARHTDLYLITECDDDGVEEAVRRLFAERGLLDGGINPHVRADVSLHRTAHVLHCACVCVALMLTHDATHMAVQKVLFCGTTIGRVHMARQLEAHMHIDGTAAATTFRLWATNTHATHTDPHASRGRGRG
jgi:hypothetical protein